MKYFLLSIASLTVFSLSACKSADPTELDYKSEGSRQEVRLDVPPDLTTPKGNTRYTIPTIGAASASSTQMTTNAGTAVVNSGILGAVEKVHIERAGTQRWLVVEDKQPEQVWPVLKAFWQEMGFTISSEEPEIGLMQTDWAENRAKLPNDFFRKLLERAGVGFIYSTPERDKFLIRMEKTNKGTEVFFTHKGLYEIYTTEKKNETVWQPRPSDPELEAAFLGRFMVRLGINEQQAQRELATQAQNPEGSRAKVEDGTLIVIDPIDRAWRRVGLALDRVGLIVSDRDRSQGIYYVRPVQAELKGEDKKGFFKKLFAKKPKQIDEAVSDIHDLRVKLTKVSDAKTSVILLDAKGQKISGKEINTTLSRLQTELQ